MMETHTQYNTKDTKDENVDRRKVKGSWNRIVVVFSVTRDANNKQDVVTTEQDIRSRQDKKH
jgi:hypothetical protein